MGPVLSYFATEWRPATLQPRRAIDPCLVPSTTEWGSSQRLRSTFKRFPLLFSNALVRSAVSNSRRYDLCNRNCPSLHLRGCAGDQAGVAAHAWIIPVVGALISFLGVPAGLIGNELSIRYGLRTIATLVFLLSALAGGLLGFTAMLPYITVLGLSVIAGFIVQGNF